MVCLLVCHDVSATKPAEPIVMPFRMLSVDSDVLREPCIRYVSRSPYSKGQFFLGGGRCQPWSCPDMSVSQYTQSNPGGAELARCECRLGSTRWGAHWCHLVYTIELRQRWRLMSNYFQRLL